MRPMLESHASSKADVVQGTILVPTPRYATCGIWSFFFFFFFLARADERAQQALCFNGHTNLIVLPRPKDTHNETPIERERKRELCSDAKRTSGAYVFDKLLLKPARQRDDRKKPSLVEYIGEDRGGDRVEMYANERGIERR